MRPELRTPVQPHGTDNRLAEGERDTKRVSVQRDLPLGGNRSLAGAGSWRHVPIQNAPLSVPLVTYLALSFQNGGLQIQNSSNVGKPSLSFTHSC